MHFAPLPWLSLSVKPSCFLPSVGLIVSHLTLNSPSCITHLLGKAIDSFNNFLMILASYIALCFFKMAFCIGKILVRNEGWVWLANHLASYTAAIQRWQKGESVSSLALGMFICTWSVPGSAKECHYRIAKCTFWQHIELGLFLMSITRGWWNGVCVTVWGVCNGVGCV